MGEVRTNWLENYKTSVSGLMAAIGLAGMNFAPEKYRWMFAIVSAVGTAGLGFSAKDGTTHSTLAQVEVATKQEEKKEVTK